MATADKGIGYFVRTKNQPHRYRLVWTIENFLHYPAEVGSFVVSPNFKSTSGVDQGVEWSLRIYPNGQNKEHEDFISVFLFLQTLPKRIVNITAKLDVSILNVNQEKLNTKRDTILRKQNVYGWTEFIKRDDLKSEENDYLPDGHLTFECNVEAYIDFVEPVHSTRINSENYGLIPSDLGAEIVKMIYQEKICPDVKLKASDGRVFDAHKCVLSVRSSYFKGMFQHQMKENEEGVVDLSKDMNGPELESLLQYLYLGTPPANLSDVAVKMFQIGDMQGIPELRGLSEAALIGQLDDDNAVDSLNFADKHNAKKLKKIAATQIANSNV